MSNKNYEQIKIIKDSNVPDIFELKNTLNVFVNKINSKIFLLISLFFVNNIIFILLYSKNSHRKEIKENIIERRAYNNKLYIYPSEYLQKRLKMEINRPCLNEINKKRTFEKRFPLPKEITCKPHFKAEEIVAFLSFLTKNTIYFETGSGCSSLIAKYYITPKNLML